MIDTPTSDGWRDPECTAAILSFDKLQLIKLSLNGQTV